VEILTHSLGGTELLEAMPAVSLGIDSNVEPLAPATLPDTLAMNPWLQAS
jgi:hypothetical protein